MSTWQIVMELCVLVPTLGSLGVWRDWSNFDKFWDFCGIDGRRLYQVSLFDWVVKTIVKTVRCERTFVELGPGDNTESQKDSQRQPQVFREFMWAGVPVLCFSEDSRKHLCPLADLWYLTGDLSAATSHDHDFQIEIPMFGSNKFQHSSAPGYHVWDVWIDMDR